LASDIRKKLDANVCSFGYGKGESKQKGEGKGKGMEKGMRRWKEESLRKVGCTDGRTDTRVILYSLQCIALDRQIAYRN